MSMLASAEAAPAQSLSSQKPFDSRSYDADASYSSNRVVKVSKRGGSRYADGPPEEQIDMRQETLAMMLNQRNSSFKQN